MNMKSNIFSFVEVVMNLFAGWLSFETKQWDWCPVKVDNRIDRF